MATSDQEQRSINVPQHKRLAQGEKLYGTSLKGSGDSAPKSTSSKGGLNVLTKKK
jgi:uncharacterized membrane protein